MRVSIITAVYNRATTVSCAIESVRAQSYGDIEHIVVDGLSTDGTAEVVDRYSDWIAKSIRERDNGIYDALNKGIRHATGDVIGFLHADDFLAHPRVIEQVASQFRDDSLEGLYGDLMYVGAEPPHPLVRYWESGPYDVHNFLWGWMPPHPTVYLRRTCYEQYGCFREDFQIAADYELMLRMMVKHRICVAYQHEVLVKMRVGGKSNASLRNRLRANREDEKAWHINDLQVPFGLRITKPLRKLSQYWRKPQAT